MAPALAVPAPRNACGEAVGENVMAQCSPSEFDSAVFCGFFFFFIVGEFSFLFFHFAAGKDHQVPVHTHNYSWWNTNPCKR